MLKPIFIVDIGSEALSSLEAHLPLALTPIDGYFHRQSNLRLPLGIYNVSVSRVCDKVNRLCRRLESYFNAAATLEPLRASDEVMEELIDYIELSLYAAAEHVDDIDLIATGYFKSVALRDKNSSYRALQKEIKKHKRLISAAANAIKHQQSRIRLFSLEFSHGKVMGCLHGYFIEGVEEGVVCPSGVFHKSQDVFSITTLVWEILVFLLNCSRDLANFIRDVSDQMVGPVNIKSQVFSRSVIAAARLPLYGFGEEHPFSRVTLSIINSGDSTDLLASGLYGSITCKWSRSSGATFGSCASRFSGDGSSNTFRFAQPKSVVLHHWD